VDEPRDSQQREEASPNYERASGGVPPHMQAAAEAAGEENAWAGAQSIGYGAHGTGADALRAEALHGHVREGSTHHAMGTADPLAMLMAFDDHNRPSPDLIDDCVHCGFCLPSCPTYLLWGEEMDSPRGRIYLMKLGNEGAVGMTDTFVRHFDQCLGCMACMTACPSGVQYDKLIEATRHQIERRHARTKSDRLFKTLIFALFPHPNLLRATLPLLWLYQASGLRRLVRRGGLLSRLPGRLAGLHDLVPAVRLKDMGARVPAHVPPKGERRARVGVLTGCVQRVFFPRVNQATVRVLAAEGCEVYAPPGQGCCGALAFHSGREEEARRFARKLIAVFEQLDLDYVAVNAAGCGSTMKEYGYLLRDDPDFAVRAANFAARVRDATELLADLGPVAPRRPLRARVAYHDACHLAHAQGIRRQPRSLLESIPGIELVPIVESEICCGSAGIYNLVEPQPAAELGERKARHILSSGAQIVASANPGCTLQLQVSARRLGRSLKVLHPIEILDRSISIQGPKSKVQSLRRRRF
jgi:glycolate oxidase iron-sulfur subunit